MAASHARHTRVAAPMAATRRQRSHSLSSNTNKGQRPPPPHPLLVALEPRAAGLEPLARRRRVAARAAQHAQRVETRQRQAVLSRQLRPCKWSELCNGYEGEISGRVISELVCVQIR